MLALLIAAHLCGDFLLQNHWMQRKSRSSWVCSVHVAAYALPFLPLLPLAGLPAWALGLILAQHWLQDRCQLHLRWMRLYGQTTPERWPAGPLCVDQAMHVTWLAVVALILRTPPAA